VVGNLVPSNSRLVVLKYNRIKAFFPQAGGFKMVEFDNFCYTVSAIVNLLL
jgi:hypothetical protein